MIQEEKVSDVDALAILSKQIFITWQIRGAVQRAPITTIGKSREATDLVRSVDVSSMEENY